MKESQVTFSDISNNSIDDVYESIIELSFILTDSDRSRAGNNCPTVTELSHNEHRKFGVKLPPRSDTLDIDDVPSKYTINYKKFNRLKMEEIFIFIVDVDVILNNLNAKVKVEFIFPGEDPIDSEDKNRPTYNQFDFKKFLEQTEL